MEFYSLEEKIAGLEALLFIYGEPLASTKIESIFGLGRGEGAGLVSELQKKLAADDRGITILNDGEKVQLVTKARWGEILAAFVKEELKEELTPASLETLAIVAFLGPISRSRIEYLRGVNSLFTLRNLRIRGLVERAADPENANAFVYRPSLALLKHLGVTKKEELPEHERLQSLLTQFEAPPSGE